MIAYLEDLNLIEGALPNYRGSVRRFRDRLTDSIYNQECMARWDYDGQESFSRRQYLQEIEGQSNSKVVRTGVKSPRWWWENDSKAVFLCIHYNGRVLELAPGKRIIRVGDRARLVPLLEMLRFSALHGELDYCNDQVHLRRAVHLRKKEQMIHLAKREIAPRKK